jgi:hypothetical protein
MSDIIAALEQITAGQWALALAALATLIEITPIKLDPWTALFRAIGKAMNKDIADKLDQQAKDVESLHTQTQNITARLEQKDAEDARNHILRFGDEIKNKVRHSEEYFNQILDDITKYEQYCETHKDFKNARTVATVQIINEVYQKCLKEKDFL